MQAQQVLDGIQHKVESEMRKGMDCLAHAKVELQVCTSFCTTLHAVCCLIPVTHLASVGMASSHSSNAACCLAECLHLCSIAKVWVEQGVSVCPFFCQWTALSIATHGAFRAAFRAISLCQLQSLSFVTAPWDLPSAMHAFLHTSIC